MEVDLGFHARCAENGDCDQHALHRRLLTRIGSEWASFFRLCSAGALHEIAAMAASKCDHAYSNCRARLSAITSPIQLLGGAPVDEAPGLPEWLRRPCLDLVGAAVGSAGLVGFAAGALCSGDGAGVSAVCAKAVCKVVTKAIREMQESVLVMVTSVMLAVGRMKRRL